MSHVILELKGYQPRKVPMTAAAMDRLAGHDKPMRDLGIDLFSKLVKSINIMENNAARSTLHLNARGTYMTIGNVLATHFGMAATFWHLEANDARNETYGTL